MDDPWSQESKAVFPDLFSFATPLRSSKDIWRHPWLFCRYENQGIATICCIPVTCLWHPSVPRNPGLESLVQGNENVFVKELTDVDEDAEAFSVVHEVLDDDDAVVQRPHHSLHLLNNLILL